MAKDDGIARLNNGVLISEETRDRLNKQIEKLQSGSQKTYEFDPNQATTQELEKFKFSGFRVNVFTNQLECWCVGQVLGTESMQIIEKNPNALAELHERCFMTTGSVIEIDAPIQPNRKQKRKTKIGRSGKR